MREIAYCLTTIPLAFIDGNESAFMIITMQLICMKRSKWHIVRLTYLVVFYIAKNTLFLEGITISLSLFFFALIKLLHIKKKTAPLLNNT